VSASENAPKGLDSEAKGRSRQRSVWTSNGAHKAVQRLALLSLCDIVELVYLENLHWLPSTDR
jgi:hypothetical protein